MNSWDSCAANTTPKPRASSPVERACITAWPATAPIAKPSNAPAMPNSRLHTWPILWLSCLKRASSAALPNLLLNVPNWTSNISSAGRIYPSALASSSHPAMHVLRKTRPADLGHLRSGSLGALLEGLIDYAGLFPPAGLPMESAVRNYAAYRGSELHWILGRFIVPVARLAEFENALAALPDEADSPLSWSLSVLAGADLSDDIAR